MRPQTDNQKVSYPQSLQEILQCLWCRFWRTNLRSGCRLSPLCILCDPQRAWRARDLLRSVFLAGYSVGPLKARWCLLHLFVISPCGSRKIGILGTNRFSVLRALVRLVHDVHVKIGWAVTSARQCYLTSTGSHAVDVTQIQLLCRLCRHLYSWYSMQKNLARPGTWIMRNKKRHTRKVQRQPSVPGCSREVAWKLWCPCWKGQGLVWQR